MDASKDAAFTLEVLRPEVAATTPLQGYTAVVLNDLGTLPQALADSLQRYVNAGGGLLVALGPSSAVLPKVPVDDETIQAGTRYASREGDLFLTVSETDTGHPVLQNLGRFEGVRFYQVIHVTADKSHVLMRLNDQTPLLLERQVGGGKVLVFTPRRSITAPTIFRCTGLTGCPSYSIWPLTWPEAERSSRPTWPSTPMWS